MTEKVLGVGFHKTGTTSLGHALRVLGYGWTGWNTDVAMLHHRGHVGALLDMTDDYDCFEDFPWPLYYREIVERHPGTKFVLTHRKDMDTWFDSLARHCDRYPPEKWTFRSCIYGFDDPREDPDHVKSVHRKHVDDVRAFAAERNVPLLEMCFENGDGWEELCGFLGRPVPDQPFPLANADPNKGRAKPLTRLRRMVLRWA